MAPENILAYVAAQEVAHLKHMDHSNDFWETVEYLFGPYKNERTWLKQNGSSLHRYKFESWHRINFVITNELWTYQK